MSELASALIILGAKYGIPWITELIRTANNPSVSADDLLAVLALAKPYEAYFPPAPAPAPTTGSEKK